MKTQWRIIRKVVHSGSYYYYPQRRFLGIWLTCAYFSSHSDAERYVEARLDPVVKKY